MLTLLPWIGLGIVLLLAGALHLQARSEARSRAQGAIESEKLGRELVAAREQLEESQRERRQRSEETSELRRKLEKVKRRAAGARDQQRREPERIQHLEAELANAREDLAAVREQALELEARLAREHAQRKAAEETAASAAVPEPPPESRSEEAEALERRAAQATAEAARQARELVVAHAELERLGAKLSTARKLYMTIRGELEASRDRGRAQQELLERLQALRASSVAVAAEGSAARPGETHPTPRADSTEPDQGEEPEHPAG